jgi:hypothetical protein
MSNWVISQIRTFVPILVGTALTWIAKKTGFVIDEETGAQAVMAATAGAIAVYYFVVHWLEQKWPAFGKLLGKQTLPYYDVVPPTDDAVGIQP